MDKRVFSNGFTLVELVVVVSMLSLIAVMTFSVAKGEYHHYRVQAMVAEFQHIANVQYLNNRYTVEIEIAGLNSARGDIGLDDEEVFDRKYATFTVDIPSHETIRPYGVDAVEFTDNDGGTYSRMTFFSQQSDPLISLYLANPFVSREMSELITESAE